MQICLGKQIGTFPKVSASIVLIMTLKNDFDPHESNHLYLHSIGIYSLLDDRGARLLL